ncbi:hypothetical protein HK099_005768 [Clydaea vesicula]|uniref:Ribosomal protein n=1 Tax=Clydaea vesicula TaxID=447962 RepID=A0AAD5XYP7_9FUNG|nr:hypothetical protein HK099_005768 [Clydaea vesicula]
MQSPFLLSQKRHFDKKKFFKLKKAFKLQENAENVSFKDSIDVLRTYTMGEDLPTTIHLKIKKSDSGKILRGEVNLPNQLVEGDKGDGSTILVFAKGEAAEEARRLGAHIVGGEELVKEVSEDKHVFQKVLSTKEMYPHVVKIGRYLGPKGLMPSPGKGTVNDDIASMMQTLKASTKYEMDEDGFVHLEIAKTGWKDEKIIENIKSLMESLNVVKPAKTTLKRLIVKIGLSSKYSPGVIFNRAELVPSEILKK